MIKVSYVIGYKHIPERFKLFKESLKCLLKYIDKSIEICIHEADKEAILINYVEELGLTKLGYRFRYMFTKFTGIFDRATILNMGVRNLATGENIVVIDMDILYTKEWVKETLNCNYPAICWNKYCSLTKEKTDYYFNTNKIDTKGGKWRKASRKSCGVATLIPREIYYRIKGFDEDFSGSWGGEELALWAKLIAFGYPAKKFNCDLIHLYHKQTTLKVDDVRYKWLKMSKWSVNEWKERLYKIGDNWGRSFTLVTKPVSISRCFSCGRKISYYDIPDICPRCNNKFKEGKE